MSIMMLQLFNTSLDFSGQVNAPEGFTYWLFKFDGTTFSEHDKITSNPQGIGNIEYTYYRMAKDCGIDMMESRLLTEGRHQMSINGKQDDFRFNDLKVVGERTGINHPNEIIEKTVSIAANWNEYAKDCGVKTLHAKHIFENLILADKSKDTGLEMGF